jgi:hypothetical protein
VGYFLFSFFLAKILFEILSGIIYRHISRPYLKIGFANMCQSKNRNTHLKFEQLIYEKSRKLNKYIDIIMKHFIF